MEIYKKNEYQELVLTYRLLCWNLAADKRIGSDVALMIYREYLLPDLAQRKKKELEEKYIGQFLQVIDYRYDYANVIETYSMHREIFEDRIYEVATENIFEDKIFNTLDYLEDLDMVQVVLIDGEDDRDYGFHYDGSHVGTIKTALHNELFSPENLQLNKIRLNAAKEKSRRYNFHVYQTTMSLEKYGLKVLPLYKQPPGKCKD